MKRMTSVLILMLPAIVGMVAGCSESQVVSEPSLPPSAQVRSQSPPLSPTFDDEFARIAREEVPGFAGYYIDQDTNTVILLVDQKQATLAVEYVRQERERIGLSPARSVTVRTVRHDFAALKDWRDRIEPYIDGDGAFLLDIDEVENRLLVGVVDEVARKDFLNKSVAAGIPDEAVLVEIQPPPEFRTSLQDYRRPLAGGLQVTNSALAGQCSLGFMAVVGSAARFVTASHCTPTRFGLDGSTANQPSSGYPIGSEVLDPALRRCGLFLWCRFSDMSLFSVFEGVTYERGRIARTVGYPEQGGPGSLIIDDTQPYLDILWKWNLTTHAPVGTFLEKVGRTSGWTSGSVTQSCVTISVGGNQRLTCQWVTNIWSQPGDSGSPIFWRIPGNRVALHGSLWGGPAGDWNTTWHSPLSGIESDFGLTLSVCIPSAGC